MVHRLCFFIYYLEFFSKSLYIMRPEVKEILTITAFKSHVKEETGVKRRKQSEVISH